jgi:hypothetical protein
MKLEYKTLTFRLAGLDAKWSKTSKGAPIIVAKVLGGRWYAITAGMWKEIQRSGKVRDTFEDYTALGSFFSIPI